MFSVGDLVYLEGPATSLKSNSVMFRRWGIITEDFGHEVRVKWLREWSSDQGRKVSKKRLHRGIATFLGPISLEDGRLGSWKNDPWK